MRHAIEEHTHHNHSQQGSQKHTDDDHAVHEHGKHAGHSTAMFKNRFWLTLVLTVPVVYFSPMVGHLLGYMAPMFPGSAWIPPVLGTVIFLYGGQPFLKGGVQELKDRQPGMMLLIAMAITVAFAASWVTSLGIGGFDLDFWWELALLVAIMLLGHWIEMRALGSAQATKPNESPPKALKPSPFPNSVKATPFLCAPGPGCRPTEQLWPARPNLTSP